MPYQVIIPKPVEKQLDMLPAEIRDVIITKVIELKDNPRPHGCVKLKGYQQEYRIRIGSYRVRYEIDDETSTVALLHCMRRKDIYR